MVEIGDRVRLSGRVARVMMRRRLRSGPDWLRRRGVVATRAQFLDTVGVVWDGRQTVDPWPMAALVRIQGRSYNDDQAAEISNR
jgi:hypothetical protein